VSCCRYQDNNAVLLTPQSISWLSSASRQIGFSRVIAIVHARRCMHGTLIGVGCLIQSVSGGPNALMAYHSQVVV
jgi:hypothetical protein